MNGCPLSRRLGAEALGTALLVTAVVGSGVMAQRLSGGNGALALLCNTLPTGAMLAVLILMLAHISGAHFNPAVSLAFTLRGEMRRSELAAYTAAQITGGVAGVVLANAMFSLPLVSAATTARAGPDLWLSEALATFGLVSAILTTAAARPSALPWAVGLYISAAYWFTASTSFANPAVTVSRALTDSYSGIRPADVAGFVVAQTVGALLATGCAQWLLSGGPAAESDAAAIRDATPARAGSED